MIEDAGERQRKQEEARKLRELEMEQQMKEMFKPKILNHSINMNRSYMSQSSMIRYQQPRSRSRVMNIISEDEELPGSRNMIANYRSQEQLPPAKEPGHQSSPLFMRTDQFEKLYLN